MRATHNDRRWAARQHPDMLISRTAGNRGDHGAGEVSIEGARLMRVSARDFIHPEDQAALEHLKSIPIFDSCVAAFLKIFTLRTERSLNMARMIRLGPAQLPDIYQYIKLPCEVFGISEPEFFLELDAVPNAYTAGTNDQHFVVVNSALLQAFEPDEIQATIGHECGHIVCGHVLYHTMARYLIQFGSDLFGPLRALSMPVQLALLYWYRRSELSCDRAASVVMRGPDSVVDTMVRFAGGPREITQGVDFDLYAKQVDDYDKLLESNWDQLLVGLRTMQMTHPFPAVRAREIKKWCGGNHFKRIIRSLEDGVDSCSLCGEDVGLGWNFCRRCGAAVT